MIDKVQLKHPQGKKPIRMSKEKYDLLKPALLKYLRTRGKATFGEISSAIEKHFKTKEQRFQGSLAWHLEWVKLDLEARKLIRRVPDTSPQEYMIVP
ncbi:MAG TPA: hypothetical protein VF514_06600 [Bacteroidota bacterium]